MTDKAFWSGELCFGIVNIPISLGISRKSHDHVFKQYVKGTETPVGRMTTNKHTGEEVKADQIVRGIEVPGFGMVLLDKSETDTLTPETNHSIKIEKFFHLDRFDFNRFDTSYNVIPDDENETGYKAFILLSNEMMMQNKGAFVKIKLRHREQLCLLHSNRFGMVCSTLYYEDEIIKQQDYIVPKITDDEINAARALVDAMTVEDSEYSNEQDTYWHAMTDLIISKAQ